MVLTLEPRLHTDIYIYTNTLRYYFLAHIYTVINATESTTCLS
ncbi:MAG: hypothetical protein ACKPKO_52765 [Candidatus Fonsibacter sp.]